MPNNILLGIVEITNKCNLRCKHCYGNFNGCQEMPLEDFKQVVYELIQNGCKILYVTGGEPLLHSKITKIGAYLNCTSLATRKLITNGLLLKKFDTKFLSCWNSIQISLDGMHQKNDHIRGNGTFENIISSLNWLSRKHGNVDIMFTINKSNFADYKPIYALSQRLNVNLGIEIFTNNAHNNNLEMLNGKQYREILQFCLKNSIGCNDPLINVLDKKQRKILFKNREICGCLAGISAVCIDYQGDVYPCPRIRDKMGNIFISSFEEILSKSDFSIRNRTRELSGKCGRCQYKFICGGCRAQAYSLNHNFYSENPYCFINDK